MSEGHVDDSEGIRTATTSPSFIDLFNACTGPKDCITLVEDHGLSTEALCTLLHAAMNTATRPSVEILGECLGHHSPFWKEVASSFASHFEEFSGLDIVASLRLYLWTFRLPGESGPIERILEGFARGFIRYNQPFAGDPGRVNAASIGWFTQPTTSLEGKYIRQCCAACGAVEDREMDLRLCTGCRTVAFCRRCARLSSRHGHSIGCSVGYGRACVAALAEARRPSPKSDAGTITTIIFRSANGQYVSEEVGEHMQVWPKGSPLIDEDAALVLSYAIVMLSTNQHNPSVKPAEKMAFNQFAKQLHGVNGGSNFPSDFLHEIYEAVCNEELKVRK